ncbi:hypothetical protein FRC11_011290 [Ceratobasidium sp. 423]|nr:hypothetical protein FRC11_011290 [Ceratobasidium sp. 423]
MATDKSLELWAQQAANHARLKLNKYYQATDSSHLYRMAIRKYKAFRLSHKFANAGVFSLAKVLHPSMQMAYLEKAKWQKEWMDQAHNITTNCWNQHYKLENYETMEDNALQSNFGYLSYMDEIFDSIAAKQDKTLDPVNMFIKDKIIIERTKTGKKLPVNPLAWWHAKRIVGEHHDGLTQMAIDVLSTPGILDAAHKKACEEAQAKAQARAAKAKAQPAVAEAEAITAEETPTEGSGDEDDEDVLGPSSDAEEEVGGGVSSDDE